MNFKVDNVLLSSDFGLSDNVNDNDITDVVIQLKIKNKYIASFFSFSYIDKISRENKENGKFLSGSYFWEKNMVLVKECSANIIEPVVKDLIDEGNFREAFSEL